MVPLPHERDPDGMNIELTRAAMHPMLGRWRGRDAA